jgi:poly(ADP-ribose) glycohydrolase ARH3
MAPTQDQYKGCLLGLAMGDTLGAPHEGGLAERAVWRAIGRTRDGLRRWTDDTQMTLDLAESLLSVGALDQDDLSHRFAHSYSWSRGYGPGTARILKRIRRGEPWSIATRAVHKAGSFGNGAAMRTSVLSLFFTDDIPALVSETRKAAETTHCHPLGIEGAVLISVATHKLLNGATKLETLSSAASYCLSVEFQERLRLVEEWLVANALPEPREVANRLGNGMSAQSSCVSALYIALRHLQASFNELIEFVIACKGDVDTIGAMAGTLWGTYNGASALPKMPLEQQAAIESTATRLYERGCKALPDPSNERTSPAQPGAASHLQRSAP